MKVMQVTVLAPTTESTYLKMIQWLNVRAVHAIKANVFEGRTPESVLSLSSPLFFLLASVIIYAHHPGWFEG